MVIYTPKFQNFQNLKKIGNIVPFQILHEEHIKCDREIVFGSTIEITCNFYNKAGTCRGGAPRAEWETAVATTRESPRAPSEHTGGRKSVTMVMNTNGLPCSIPTAIDGCQASCATNETDTHRGGDKGYC
jgi:hypothetical protein